MGERQKQSASFDAAEFLRHLTHKPGVYRMFDAGGGLVYVGKAKDLKKRVSTYFRKPLLEVRERGGTRTQMMMRQVRRVEVTVTATESEALLLENNLIKEHRPRYNVLLRDDKSYPYIQITADAFPRFTFYRGSRKQPGRYFGPYSSVGAVRETLNLLFKLFRLRQCDASFFNNRTRPCLQYQIKRCSAPCVGLIDEDAYRDDVRLATEVLSGNAKQVIETLVARMDEASADRDYERAARARDQIRALRLTSEQQRISADKGDTDVIACSIEGGSACVQVFSVRGGLNIGNRAHYPALPHSEIDEGALLAAFIGQYYLSRKPPKELIVSHAPDDADALQAMLEHQAGRKVVLTTAVRGGRRKWVELALDNAALALDARMSSRAGMYKRLLALQEVLGLVEIPARMECFDASHMQGEATVVSCVVFDVNGPLKSEYRRFNVAGITGGDDYAAMRQAIERRYRGLAAGEGKLPDVLFIDGGKGQVKVAHEVLQEFGIGGVTVVGIAKGPERKPGMETLLIASNESDAREVQAADIDPTALHLAQQVRDEAHRFAITGHRGRRAGKRKRSPLENIAGLGPKRRRLLLKHFGGLHGIERASADDLGRVSGISRRLAQSIYENLHAGRMQ